MAYINVKIGVNRPEGLISEKTLESIDDRMVVEPPTQREMVALKLRAAICAARKELKEGYRFGDILQSYVLEDLLQNIKNMMNELDVNSDSEDIHTDICYIKMTDVTSLAFYKGNYGDRYYLQDTVDKVSNSLVATLCELEHYLSTQWSGDLMLVTAGDSDLTFVVPARSIRRALRSDYVAFDVTVTCDGFSCVILTPDKDHIYNLLDNSDKWCLSATYAIIACLADQGDLDIYQGYQGDPIDD